jgi:hypothetical protein
VRLTGDGAGALWGLASMPLFWQVDMIVIAKHFSQMRNTMRGIGLLFVCSLIGCSNAAPPNDPRAQHQPTASSPQSTVVQEPPIVAQEQPTAQSTAASTIPDNPAVVSKLDPFQVELRKFLEKSRAGAKALELVPTPSESQDLRLEMSALYAELPDVPDSYPNREALAKQIKGIEKSFNYGGAVLIFYVQNKDNQAEAKKWKDELQGAANSIRSACNDLEEALGLK